MRPIADVLRELNAGRTYDELTKSLAGLVAAVRATRRGGELSFKLKITPNGELGVEIADEIKVKLPTAARPKTLMFIDADNSLRRTDPRQTDLPLRAVPEEPEAELKTA